MSEKHVISLPRVFFPFRGSLAVELRGYIKPRRSSLLSSFALLAFVAVLVFGIEIKKEAFEFFMAGGGALVVLLLPSSIL